MFTPAHHQLVSVVVGLRKKAGLTQRELAKLLGREHNFVARIETGQRRLDLIELIQVCNACDADPVAAIGKLVKALTAVLPAIRPQPLLKSAAKKKPD